MQALRSIPLWLRPYSPGLRDHFISRAFWRAGQLITRAWPANIFLTVSRTYTGARYWPTPWAGIEPQPFFQFPARLPTDVIADAQRNLVVRDGVAAFFFHPEDFTNRANYLQTTVQGLKALGYTFVSPVTL